jgi:predicted tellurium resistance membrane protein TerC
MILTNKLPTHLREKARTIGLSLALIFRLIMLAGISWITSSKEELFSIYNISISIRDLILIVGGIFLLFKATAELHNKIENTHHDAKVNNLSSNFLKVIIQIILIDLVFSIDSIVTAVGMVDSLWMMVIAVVIAVCVMIFASASLSEIINRNPSIVILCLSFLLMIGLGLISEGLGVHIPKAYMYFAMGFSIFVEIIKSRSKKAA